jgi:mannose-1-phosphate guanylyltransferase
VIFERHATSACRLAAEFPERLVVLGATPDGPETDYGWILCDHASGEPTPDIGEVGPSRVTCFREKPATAEATRLYDAGGLWNTLVIAAKARTLWSLASRLVPQTAAKFSVLRGVIRSARDGNTAHQVTQGTVASLYREMRPADFSRDILQAAVESTVALPMRGLEWSDWGRPERVLRSLRACAER